MPAPHPAAPAGEPDLRIRLKRHPDGSASLTCIRRDGTTTWQRQRGPLGAVFPPHDLTHLAVETTLGFRQGFFGLVADGWEIADFAKPWPRGPVPPEAQEVELVVGFFDAERASGAQWTEAEFAEHAARFVASRRSVRGGEVPMPRVPDAAALARVRAHRAALLARWAALSAGDALELTFTRAPAGGRARTP